MHETGQSSSSPREKYAALFSRQRGGMVWSLLSNQKESATPTAPPSLRCPATRNLPFLFSAPYPHIQCLQSRPQRKSSNHLCLAEWPIGRSLVGSGMHRSPCLDAPTQELGATGCPPSAVLVHGRWTAWGVAGEENISWRGARQGKYSEKKKILITIETFSICPSAVEVTGRVVGQSRSDPRSSSQLSMLLDGPSRLTS